MEIRIYDGTIELSDASQKIVTSIGSKIEIIEPGYDRSTEVWKWMTIHNIRLPQGIDPDHEMKFRHAKFYEDAQGKKRFVAWFDAKEG